MADDSITLFAEDGRAVLTEGFADERWYAELRDSLGWREESIRIFGKETAVPRLVAYYGDFGYRYSGIDHPARAMPAVLERLREAAAEASGFTFNSVLCNYYRHGQDSMGYHRDNEPEIDPACIASVSFGAPRRFKLRHRPSRRVVDVDLGDGSLLLMLDCQDAWEHALPKTAKDIGGRINLTFRKLRS